MSDFLYKASRNDIKGEVVGFVIHDELGNYFISPLRPTVPFEDTSSKEEIINFMSDGHDYMYESDSRRLLERYVDSVRIELIPVKKETIVKFNP